MNDKSKNLFSKSGKSRLYATHDTRRFFLTWVKAFRSRIMNSQNSGGKLFQCHREKEERDILNPTTPRATSGIAASDSSWRCSDLAPRQHSPTSSKSSSGPGFGGEKKEQK